MLNTTSVLTLRTTPSLDYLDEVIANQESKSVSHSIPFYVNNFIASHVVS